MKKILFIISCAASILSYSQPNAFKSNTITLGYGYPNIAALALSTDVEKEGFSPFGPVILGYHKDVGKRITIGVEFGYSTAKTTPVVQGTLRYNYNLSFFTGLIRGDINYVTKPKFKIYSGIALGLFTIAANAKITEGNGIPDKYADTGSGFAFHLNACGAKFLINKSWGIYSELGIGYRGILNTGVFYNF
jgi:hypothetical protein